MSLFRKLFMSGSWQMAFRVKDNHWLFDYDQPFVPIPNHKNYWYADPLLFEDDGRVFLFCEAFNIKEQKGELAVLEWKNGTWTKSEIIITNQYHMSYPNVFKDGMKYYMIPESAECGSLELYVAEDFPYVWKKECNIIENANLADPTFFEFEGNLYLYAWDETGGKFKGCIYKLDLFNKRCSLVTEYHYQDNVARPAGYFIKNNDEMLRPAQNSKNMYGEGILWYKVKLGKDGFSEEIVDVLDVKKVKIGKYNGEKRIHTFSSCNKLEVIDFCQFKFDFFKRFKILKREWMRIKRKTGSKVVAIKYLK